MVRVADAENFYPFLLFTNIPNQIVKSWKIEDFELGIQLGEGPFSWIYSAREKESGFIVALKFLDKREIEKNNLEAQLLQEVENQKQMKHPNIIQLYGYFNSDDHITLILELAPNGDLFSRLMKFGTFNPQETAKYMCDICDGLSFLHRKRIIHRDVKLENIFLGLNNEAKIGDFGCSLRKSYDVMLCGTLEYLAPEMINCTPQSEKIDSWAIGIVIYECMCGYPPFEHDSSQESYNKTVAQILKGIISFPDHLGGDCVDLITKLLMTDPSKRLSVRDTMNHPFIRSNCSKRSLL
ncbi:auroralike protein kinase putative [Backusella circina FSU 941]|nr:auroralike protein kinase putative [Backusella circina FSU 941]